MPMNKGKVNLREAAPVGSFEYVRDCLQSALKSVQLFKDVDYYSVYLMYVYPERILVSVKDKYYEIPYEMDTSYGCTFGKPKEVEQYYIPKEITEKQKMVKETNTKTTLASELKESNVTIVKEAVNLDFPPEFISLAESTYDSDSGTIEAVLIEAGTNDGKKRHYPKSTIRETEGKWTGMKMYLNHQTAKEEKDRPERDIKEWASTIVKDWYQDGKAMATIAVHDSWLRERLADPVARKHIGLSINAGGKVSYGKVEGKDNYQIIEKILLEKQNGPASVDWVTEAGARGRVSRLLKEGAATKEDSSMELKEATFADLQRENPKLVKDLTESIQKDIKESEETKARDKKQQELEAENKRLKESTAKSEQATKVDGWLKEAKGLPEITVNRIKKTMAVQLFENDTKLREAYEATLKEEKEYLNNFSQKGKIKIGEKGTSIESGKSGASGVEGAEHVTKVLESRFGLNKDKDGDDEEDEDDEDDGKKK